MKILQSARCQTVKIAVITFVKAVGHSPACNYNFYTVTVLKTFCLSALLVFPPFPPAQSLTNQKSPKGSLCFGWIALCQERRELEYYSAL